MQQKLIEFIDVSIKPGGVSILNNINLTIHQGEHWAITGHSGSGKSLLAKAIAGTTFYSGTIRIYNSDESRPLVGLAEQQHRFKNLSNTSNFYYQQRYNSTEADDAISVKESLQDYVTPANDIDWISILQLTPILDEPLIQLSNGENKRLQLAKILFSKPRIIILDSPFIGLDAAGRKTLHDVINKISSKDITVILIADPKELPECISHIAALDKGTLAFGDNKDKYHLSAHHSSLVLPGKQLLQQLALPDQLQFKQAVKMVNVTVRYGERVALQNINWEVNKGERWSVSGPNGAGKSTLLSLITADHPQAYANEIYLFDRRKGSGESIWDIKRHIGYVSPELHLYFDQTASCFEVIASGLFDTIGLFRQLTEEQVKTVNWWMELLHLKETRQKNLLQLSVGQQRIALLARALIKNPPLLILDEPCQGLDADHTTYIRELISLLCDYFQMTLIYVTHYRTEIPTVVNKSLHLEDGCHIVPAWTDE